MENIIRHGAIRCFVFQTTVFISGILLLIFGSLKIETFWMNWVMATKTTILFVLMGLLSYVHFKLQPKIEILLSTINSNTKISDNFSAQLKPFRVLRKRLATICLFWVITTIILGLQVYAPFPIEWNLILIGCAVLFAYRANKTLILFGWV